MKPFLILPLLLLNSFSVNSATCSVNDAKVTSTFQWSDGSIFIIFDKSTDCNCPIKNRLGFHKNDDEKFFISAALTAYTTGKPVTAWAEDVGCLIHGNTAKLHSLQLK